MTHQEILDELKAINEQARKLQEEIDKTCNEFAGDAIEPAFKTLREVRALVVRSRDNK